VTSWLGVTWGGIAGAECMGSEESAVFIGL
jgi:hypothetical protein